MISGVLTAAVIAPLASACAPRENIRVERVVATPIVTRSPSPRPVAKAPPSPPRRSDATRRVARHDDVGGIPFVWMEVADCESGDGPHAFGPPFHPNWAYEGPQYTGGVDFTYGTWNNAWAHAIALHLVSGPALDAGKHDARTQVKVAQAWLAITSWAQWPACSRAIGLR